MEEPLQETSIEEQLEDLDHVNDWAAGAALWSTDWTAETILNQLNRGNIDLNPSFQRRSAWSDKKQSLFIESLILGLPIPQIILAEDRARKGSYIVIDGKQRLLAIRRFASENDADGFEPLCLRNLSERRDLNDITYSLLLNSDEYSDELAAFQNASIRAAVIRNWTSETYLYEVFLRINTGSVQLSPQELRQALHPGPFSEYVDQASSESEEIKIALNLSSPDFRMRDAELLLRYLAYKNFQPDYAGNLKRFLDDATSTMNREWDSIEADVLAQVEEMENAFRFTRDIFGDDEYMRKWNGELFEPRKNRAVFDIMLHFFSDPLIRAAVHPKAPKVKERFKELCEDDADFLASIERTTKSLGANDIRFNKWAAALSEIGNVEIESLIFHN